MSRSFPYRLAIVATHPIQYQAPWFRALAAHARLDLQVLYGHKATAQDQAGAGFGVDFEWDLPLLEGYSHSFLRNVAKRPSVATFRGIDTPEIAGLISRGKFDAVLVSGWQYKSLWQAILACWRTGTKVMVRGDSHLHTPRTSGKVALKNLLYRRFVPRFDACLAVGGWSREYFLEYGARPERIFIVPHVADEIWLGAEASRLGPLRADLRRQFGLGDTATVFAFVAKLTDKKRPADFIRAIALAAQRGASVQGLIVGDGPLRRECEVLVRAGNVPIVFAGFLNQSEIARAYVAADALVLPSDGRETWGLVVNEAMLLGKPCLVSDQVGCGPDLVSSGETGGIFPLGDVTALSELIIALASDRARLEVMGSKCRRQMEGWSIRVAVENTVAAVESVRI
jgi:glycosyltransferase involved in cell wall biosynthesis